MKNVIKSIKIAMAALIALPMLTACEKEFYKDEQYRKEVYIVSGDNNVFGQEYEYGTESVGYLSLYVAGTTPIDQDVTVVLERDPEGLRNYNSRMYGDDTDSYASELPASSYTIDNYTVVLKADNSEPYTKFPIKVNVDNLLPDKVYFLPMRIVSVDHYMISEARRSVLFRVYPKNAHATTKRTTYVQMVGTDQQFKEEPDGTFTPLYDPEGGLLISQMNTTKTFVPISEIAVRTSPGAVSVSETRTLRAMGLKVSVLRETVEIPVLVDGVPTGEYETHPLIEVAPWLESAESVLVGGIDNEPSYYDEVKGIYVLSYRYKTPAEANWHFMKEEIQPLNVN